MTNRLQRALEEQKQSTQQEILRFTGILGIPLSGSRVVEVPTRKGCVYVRLRDNPSEVIQAYNNQVAPSYNLPVVVERIGNKYIVSGVDTERYENNWNSYSPYLPRHGNTHSFDIESGGGGDIVWVYPRQFMPLLVFPSGSLGSPNVIVAPYTLRKDSGSWQYVGNTGTNSFASYRPSSPTGAVMGLVYLDTNNGNPYLLINSGTVFSNSITGSSQIVPYIPQLPSPSSQIPLAAIRLITGTNQISWDNIYDVRQFLHNTPTGTGGGGGSINTGTLDARYLKLDASNDPITGPLKIQINSNGDDTYALNLYVANNGFTDNGAYIEAINGYPAYFTSYGRPALLLDQVLNDGTSSLDSVSRISRYAVTGVASATFDNYGYHLIDWHDPNVVFEGGLLLHTKDGASGIRLVDLNPYASATGQVLMVNAENNITGSGRLISMKKQGVEIFSVNGLGSTNIPSGTTYNVGGIPHTHSVIDSTGWISRAETWTRTGNHTFTISGDYTSVYRKSVKVRYKDGGSYEYGVVKSSSHAAGTTTVTLITNSDYAMAAATITDKAISLIENPDGFPYEFNFTSTVTYAGGTTDPNSITISLAIWRTIKGDIQFTINATLARGAGNRTFIIFSTPIIVTGTAPIPGMDTITAAGLTSATVCYGQTSAGVGNIYYFRTMANDGDIWINGAVPFS